MKKKYKITGTILIIVLSLGAFLLYPYIAPNILKQYNTHTAEELGYVPGQLIIRQKGAFNTTSKEGLKEFKNFLQIKSEEFTPIILKKLVTNGKLEENSINDRLIDQLEKKLITYDKYKGNGYEIYLIVAIDNAVIEVAEELAKEEEIEQAHENGVGSWF